MSLTRCLDAVFPAVPITVIELACWLPDECNKLLQMTILQTHKTKGFDYARLIGPGCRSRLRLISE